MSNPTAIIGNFILEPADPQVIRKTYTRIVYDAQKFFTYGKDKFDPSYSSFDPSDRGEEFYMLVPIADALNDGGSPPAPLKPDFVSDESWEGLQASASGFITAVNSVLPKIIIPSLLLVDNGIKTAEDTFAGSVNDAGGWKDVFSWELVSLNDVSVPATDSYKYAHVGPNYGSQYVTVKAKDDLYSDNKFVIKLENPLPADPDPPPYGPPLGSAHDWLKSDSTDLVVGRATDDDPRGGAFVLMLNVVPVRAASSKPEYVSKKPWSVTLEFGEVKMVIVDSGSTEITLGNGIVGAEENKTTVNLAEGKTKGGPIQQQHINDKEPFIILVYPVWNGLVVASGVQDAYATVFSSSYYVPRIQKASVMASPYSNGFDAKNPAPVEVDVGTPGEDDYVLVDFGDSLTVTAKNCRFELAYIPCFFSKNCWFDEWRVQSDDQGGVVSFAYKVYPIWTKNGTASDLSPAPNVTASSFDGPIDDTHYAYTKWRLQQDHFNRISGEIFGSILEVTETRDFPIKNNNGNFDLNWTVGSPGDPSPTDWKKYIQSIQVTIALDNSNGSIMIDKYGVAGQHAEPIQSIGAITIEMQGGYGTQAGSIFQGLAMGVADSRTAEGATWTVPLFGLEKKLEDIALINVPFFDGEQFSTVIDFLCRYAGIIDDLSYAHPTDRLSMTEDINAVIFDWKAGTTVKQALDDVMANTLHSYVVRDGKIFFYKLDGITGLPLILGTNWQPLYPETKVVMYSADPDFEDMRNEIVVTGLEQIPGGQGAQIQGMPDFPRVVVRKTTTVPNIAWARTIVKPLPGYTNVDELGGIADKLAAQLSKYELIGRTSIAGNADIRPYDRWGDFVIASVTHNIDFKSKSWTTDLEFMRKTRTF